MSKHYGVWNQPKDGSLNGKWDTISDTTKKYCEDMVRSWNSRYPDLKHEVREYPVKQ